MLGKSLLKTVGLASILSNTVAAHGCISRGGGQYFEDPSFDSIFMDYNSVWGHNANAVRKPSTPGFPAHSGDYAALLNATYSKTAEGEMQRTYSYVQQELNGVGDFELHYIKGYYKVLSNTKGASCPDISLPLAPAKLTISYGEQNHFHSIDLHPTSGYVEINFPFIPESNGRYALIHVEYYPWTGPVAAPGCGEVTVLIDDFTWTDPGHVCWPLLGCYLDSPSTRLLPHHGRIPYWPSKVSIDHCQQACEVQGHTFAGLENGEECWCGDTFVPGTLVPASECNTPCRYDGDNQWCGGPGRVDVYQKP